jgi:release factor glutamine methyltransferase
MSLTAVRTPMELVHLSAAHLKLHGSDSSRLDAELLVAQALDCRRLDLYLEFERPLDEEEVVRVRELVRRRATGEPVAYITGEKEFYGRAFRVTRDTLIPRPETELLVEAVLAWTRKSGLESPRILDLGSGSGCVGITLAAELPDAKVVMTDINKGALEVARANAQRHNVMERATFASGDWWLAIDAGQEWDIVVSNPPYITSGEIGELPRDVCDFEPLLALEGGLDGLNAYRKIAEGLAAANARFIALEIDPRRVDDVLELIRTSVPRRKSSICKDLAGRDRLLVAEEAWREVPG